MKKKIALLSVLWILIGGGWIVGLNWTRWIAGDGESMPDTRAMTETSDAVYTLYDTDPKDEKTESDSAPVLRSAGGAEEEQPLEAVTAEDPSSEENGEPGETEPYILNTNTKKIHLPGCPSIADIKEKNRAECDDPEAALAEGYLWCKRCHG